MHHQPSDNLVLFDTPADPDPLFGHGNSDLLYFLNIANIDYIHLFIHFHSTISVFYGDYIY